MIGIVVVSHSAKLADGVCELAAQVAQGKARMAAAGGTAAGGIGTDAFRVLEAIESVCSDDGVLVLMDLGSAVLSAETALELLDEERRAKVRLCPAPLVEGAVAAASLAAVGAPIEEVMREAAGAASAKAVHLEPAAPASASFEQQLVTLPNALGLHARPAAELIRLARGFRARVLLENVTRATGPVDASGMNAVLGLQARQGDVLRIRAEGPEARPALACLAAFIESGCGDTGRPAPPAAPGAETAPGRIAGIPASAGIAMGPLKRLQPAPAGAMRREAADPEAERQRLLTAIAGAREETRSLHEWARVHAGKDEAGIFDAQLLFLEDPALAGAAERMILDERVNADFAWHTASEAVANQMAALPDAYLKARAADVRDVAARVMRRLGGAAHALPALEQAAILAAADLTPSEVREFDPALVLGFCLEAGSANAHSVILARAMGIPAVVGLGHGLTGLPDGVTLALDGGRGEVWLEPGPEETRVLAARREAWQTSRRKALEDRYRPGCTRDGHRVLVMANINSVPGAAEAVECGAEGVGVLRTEFLFLDRASAPSEEEQCAAYEAIAAALGDRPLAIRTLDIGGDKSLPYIDLGTEANPFLGWRGIRVTLGRQDIFRTQLRAIIRAARGRKVSVLLPMISSLDELRQARAIFDELNPGDVPLGVMIEVPSSVAVADQLAREAAFFSIGTNDLTQYVMAADRTNPRVAAVADPFQPAVLRMIRQTVEAARAARIPAALCGEMAADPLATPLLLGLGLEEFSVSAKLIPELKRGLARWTMAEAGAVAREAMSLDSAEAVRRLCGTSVHTCSSFGALLKVVLP